MPNEWGDEVANPWGDKPVSGQNMTPETTLQRVWSQQTPAAPLSTTDTISGAIQRTGRSLVPGWTRMQAAMDATLPATATTPQIGATWGERYENNKKNLDQLTNQFDAEHPWASPALGIAGSVPMMLATGGLSRPAAALATPAQRIGEGFRLGSGIGGMYAAGDSRAQSVPQALMDMGSGMAVGGTTGAAIPALLEAPGVVGKAAPKAADLLRTFAGERNIKAAGGIQSDITRSRKQLGPGGINDGRAELTEIGAQMGDKGLVGPFSTPTKTFERSAELMKDAGNRMGSILDGADQVARQSGAPTPSLSNILDDGIKVLAEIKKNPNPGAQAAADRMEHTLGSYVNIVGKDKLTFSEAHQLRKWIDDEVYGLRGNKDPWTDQFKTGLRGLRSAISGEIEKSLDATTANSSAWKAANRDYQVASKALEFADKGIDRAVGNNQVSPMEVISALGGMTAGGATGSPAAAGLGGLLTYGGTALARRYGSGLQGAAALRLSNALQGVNPSRVTPEAESLAAAMARIISQRYPTVDLTGAAANQDNER